MSELFELCVSEVLSNEGGFQANPADRGNWRGNKLIGTKYGISARAFPKIDIINLTSEDAKELYYDYYWKPSNLTGINNPEIILQIFDFGVNSGKRLAIRKAQRLARVKPDGIVGKITSRAINNYCGDFLKDYQHARKVYYEYLADKYPKSYKWSLRGWLKRIKYTKLF